MTVHCVKCGFSLQKWEVSEEEWELALGTDRLIVCGDCSLYEEGIWDNFPTLALCDECGRLVETTDTLMINHLVVCEDCFVVGSVWPHAVSESENCFSCGDPIEGERNSLCANCTISSRVNQWGLQLSTPGVSEGRLLSARALLRCWRGLSFSEIGFTGVQRVLLEVSQTGQWRALVEKTQRMLELEPGNIALRYLSVVARAYCSAEPVSSAVDEAVVLLRTAHAEGLESDNLGFELMKDVFGQRGDLASRMASAMLSEDDGLPLARRIVGVGDSFGDEVRIVALNSVVSNVVQEVSRNSDFYCSLVLIEVAGALESTLDSVAGISRFYNLSSSGEHHD